MSGILKTIIEKVQSPEEIKDFEKLRSLDGKFISVVNIHDNIDEEKLMKNLISFFKKNKMPVKAFRKTYAFTKGLEFVIDTNLSAEELIKFYKNVKVPPRLRKGMQSFDIWGSGGGFGYAQLTLWDIIPFYD